MSGMTLEVGDERPGLRLSASQISKFGRCEMQWLFDKTSEQTDERAKSEALLLGTLMHRLMGAWWQGRAWEDEFALSLAEETGWEEGYAPPKIYDRASKIMEAWVQVHGTKPPFTLIALELPFDLPVPGTKDVSIRGFIDGLVNVPAASGVRVHDTVRILEFKTMGRWGREDQVSWDPQLHLYLWAARRLFKADGVIFEAISTYDYKTGDPDRRFKRIEVEYDERMVARTLDDVRRVAKRAKAVLKNPGLAVRSVGDQCKWCDHFKTCLTPWDVV